MVEEEVFRVEERGVRGVRGVRVETGVSVEVLVPFLLVEPLRFRVVVMTEE